MAAAFDPYYKWLAIPPEEQPPNHYRLLALTLYESDPDVIANAADQRMVHIKSFQSGKHSAASQKILNEVAKAKVCLLDPEKRAEYDQQLRAELAPVVDEPEPEQVAERVEITPVPRAETVSLSGRLHQSVQPWHIVAAAAAMVLLLVVVITAAFLSGGGPDEVVQTKPDNPQPKDPPPPPPEVVVRPPDTEPKPPPEVAVKPPDIKPKPPTPKPKPPPEVAVDPPVPEPEPFLSGEALTEAVEQFEGSLSQASSPEDFKAVAQQGLTLLDHAIVDGNHELAEKIAAAALAAARKAEDGELARKATLRFLDVQKPLTEPMKEEARKRLDAAGKR